MINRVNGDENERPVIIYLDDDPGCLRLFCEAFASEYRVLTASIVAQAREMLLAQEPAIIISDQALHSGVSGAQFLAAAAAKYPRSFRIMLTGEAALNDMLDELLHGAIDLFATKPWRRAEMSQMLARALLTRESNAQQQRARPAIVVG